MFSPVINVHDPGSLILMSPLASDFCSSLVPLLGYVGLGPGPEFIPYFLALLGVVGAAFIALIQWPLLVLRSYLKGKRREPEGAELQSVATDLNETPRDANDDPKPS